METESLFFECAKKIKNKDSSYLFSKNGKLYLFSPKLDFDNYSYGEFSVAIDDTNTTIFDLNSFIEKNKLLSINKKFSNLEEILPETMNENDFEWHELSKEQITKFLEASEFVTDDERRKNMLGVFIDETGTLAATNGIFCYKAEGFDGFPSIAYNVNDVIFKKLLSNKKSKQVFLGVKIENNYQEYVALKCVIDGKHYMYVNRAIEYKFVNFKVIFPDVFNDYKNLDLPDKNSWKELFSYGKEIFKEANKTDSFHITKIIFISKANKSTVNVKFDGESSEKDKSLLWKGFPKDFTIAVNLFYFNKLLKVHNLKKIYCKEAEKALFAIYDNKIIAFMPCMLN